MGPFQRQPQTHHSFRTIQGCEMQGRMISRLLTAALWQGRREMQDDETLMSRMGSMMMINNVQRTRACTYDVAH